MGHRAAAGDRGRGAAVPDETVPSLRASQVFMVLCAPALLALALAVVFVVPEVLRPGAGPVVLGAGILAQPVALLAVVRHRRTGRPQGWWSVWATGLIAVLTGSVADQAFHQTAVTALVVGPLYAAMFCSARSMLRHLALAVVVATALVVVVPGEPLVRAARVAAVDMVLVLTVAGLFVLRARLDAAVARAVAARDRADLLASRDPLTGLLNRRGLRTALAEVAVDTGEDVGAVLLDIDHFKRINDTLGHGAGDDVLVRLAAVLAATVRPGDLLARIGGEEFLVVAPGARPLEAATLAERLRAAVSADGGTPSVTVSAGVAVRGRGAPSPDVLDELYARADRMLYRAKREGRNRVCVEPSDGRGPAEVPALRQARPA
ncbi:GGDEF domain-containing protein [Kineococcus sp. NPDC059986]|uniref:GGDEF domain-containing protein n=1 Tax=Kineococcus sp. NPDC059986 TaxID=3155538 RepID=UPI00344BE305